MKKAYLLFGLAVPAVIGGVSVFMKHKKGNHTSSLEGLNNFTSGTENISNAIIREQPDLDKDLNQPERKPPTGIKRNMKRVNELNKEKLTKKNNLPKIYVGAKGGKYYLNDKGYKVYLKK